CHRHLRRKKQRCCHSECCDSLPAAGRNVQSRRVDAWRTCSKAIRCALGYTHRLDFGTWSSEAGYLSSWADRQDLYGSCFRRGAGRCARDSRCHGTSETDRTRWYGRRHASHVLVMALLQLSHIRKVYKTGDVEVPALQDISLSIETGEFVAIMG